MPRLKSILTYLNKLAPLEYAPKWDNVGLLVEPTIYSQTNPNSQNLSKILLTNDLTLKVLDEALQKKVNMIISYHPPIFGKGFLRMNQKSVKERIILKCIENEIAVYSPHTAFDCARGGVNDWLIRGCLAGSNVADGEHPPVDKAGPNYPENVGFGRICSSIETPEFTTKKAIENVLNLTKLQNVSYSKPNTCSNQNDTINSLAVCAGSGGSVLRNLAGKVDLIVTGEMSHHEILNFTENDTGVILCHHSNSERGFLGELRGKMGGEFSDLEVIVSESDRDPQLIV